MDWLRGTAESPNTLHFDAVRTSQPEGDMTLEITDPRHNAINDEMRIPYPLVGEPDSEVRVPRSAMVQGEDWVKGRIEGYFINHPKPEPRTSMRIPTYQFDPNLQQPSRRPGSPKGMRRLTKGRYGRNDHRGSSRRS